MVYVDSNYHPFFYQATLENERVFSLVNLLTYMKRGNSFFNVLTFQQSLLKRQNEGLISKLGVDLFLLVYNPDLIEPSFTRHTTHESNSYYK